MLDLYVLTGLVLALAILIFLLFLILYSLHSRLIQPPRSRLTTQYSIVNTQYDTRHSTLTTPIPSIRSNRHGNSQFQKEFQPINPHISNALSFLHPRFSSRLQSAKHRILIPSRQTTIPIRSNLDLHILRTVRPD